MWQVYWDLRRTEVTQTWIKSTCFILFACVSISNNTLPYGKTELSPSWQFDGCSLQQIYGVMWKPVGWGRDTYLWMAVTENPNMLFWCHDSCNSFSFFPFRLLMFNFVHKVNEKPAGRVCRSFYIIVKYTPCNVGCSLPRSVASQVSNLTPAFWICLLLHQRKTAIIPMSWATDEFLIRCDGHSDHDNQIN